MTAADTRVLLEDVLERTSLVFEYTRNMTETEFLDDRKTQDAVIRNLEVIGEIVKRIPEGFRSDHPHIPWKKIAGMRDKLAHDYLGVDVEAVWLVTERSLPDLHADMQDLLNS